jgi:hypothetical protein
MSDRPRILRSVPLLLASFGCVPDIRDETSVVEAPRVLALRADPAESEEDGAVALSALAVAPDGSTANVEFGLCLDRKPLTELGPVSPRCVRARVEEPGVLSLLGGGESVTARVPSDACTLFGPERPDPKPGEPSPRPVDPDLTGGFYQPIVAWLGSDVTLGAIRLKCPLSGASRDATIDYNRRYRPNQNPVVVAFERVDAAGDGAPLDLADQPLRVQAGESVRLRVTFPACPREHVCGDGVCGPLEDRAGCSEDCDEPRGCGGAETYAIYDPRARQVREEIETLVATWYATAGRFAEERTELGAGERIENAWTAPSNAGPIQLWVVLRDARGGSDWRAGGVEVVQ